MARPETETVPDLGMSTPVRPRRGRGGRTATPLAPPPPHPRQAEMDRLDGIADLLDSRFRIPIIGVRFGLDGLLGLIPGIGDVASLGPSAYLVWQGRKMGASTGTIGRMTVNTALDFVIGGIPVIGDIFDIAFKANRRNIALLKEDLRRQGESTA